MRPLEAVLDGSLVPGSNLKGMLPGASWRFLLDAPVGSRVLFLGTPSRATVRGLGGAGASVAGRAILVARWDDGGRLELADGSVDLVVVLGTRRALSLSNDPARYAELRRVASPEAPVLVEGHGLRLLGVPARLADRLGRPDRVELWATPHRGEIETAVPTGARPVLDWFDRHGLLRPSIDRHDLVRAWSVTRRRASPRRGQPRALAASGEAPAAAPSTMGRSARRGRAIVAAALAGLARTERGIDRTLPALRRQVTVLRTAGPGARGGPPAYLVSMAASAGLDVSAFGWGLAAGAEYASQKVLVPLFPPGASHPAYLVKLVRAPEYSARLERAADALEAIARLPAPVSDATPRVAFRGRTDGLAVVAETAVRGRGFREAAGASGGGLPEEALVRAVARWLTCLAEHSRVHEPPAGHEAAPTIGRLLDRYLEVYRPDPGQEAFLRRTLGPLQTPPPPDAGFPFVLQHGDPGPQNLLIADDGRIVVLDWENGDPLGLPLADLVYFLWTCAVMEGGTRGHRDPVAAGLPHLIDGSPLSPLFGELVEAYRVALDLSPVVVGPLFVASWLYQALKEAARLPASRLAGGVYARVIAACATNPEAPGLRAFFLNRP